MDPSTHPGPQGTVTVRLDRARCRSCCATHVLLPAALVAGRSYPLGVISAALVAAGQGAGSGSVADLLPSTPRATALGDTLDALAAAALATIRRFTPDQPVRLWPVINVLTRGRLLAPAFSP